ncbi:MAG: hypothetical protein ICV60_13555 [Pyrinomonadaceae bacterium]|nr:hypothetical protein [Pyrinomonadaceae bacterium]
MKNVILITLTLAATLTIITGFTSVNRSKQMPSVQLNIKDLSEHGVVIVPPSDPSYDKLVESLLPGTSRESLSTVKPLSFVVKNMTNKTIVSYSLKWEMVSIDGKTSVRKNNYVAPRALMGEDSTGSPQVIKPNTARFFSLVSALEMNQDPENQRGGGFVGTMRPTNSIRNQNDFVASQIETVKSDVTRYKAITVSIDGLVFEDGTFVGPDTTGFFDNLKALQDAKRNILEEVQRDIKQKKSADEVFSKLETIANGPKTSLGRAKTATEKYNHYFKRYASELLSMKKYSDGETAIKKALKDLDKNWIKLKKL